MKKCSKCHEEKELSCFPKDKNRRDGLFCYCKDCVNKSQREKYLKRVSLVPLRLKISRGKSASKVRDFGIDFVNTESSRVENFDDIEFARGYSQRLYD